MRRMLKRRPTPGVVIGVIALVAALGGTAIAGTKIQFGSLSKETKQKVLPYGASATQATTCDPTGTTFKDCVSAKLNVSKSFPRRAMIVADGTFTTGAVAAAGTCRLTVDGQQIGTELMHLGAQPNAHEGVHGDGFGLNAIAQSLGGSHTYALSCNETQSNIEIQDATITAITLRG